MGDPRDIDETRSETATDYGDGQQQLAAIGPYRLIRPVGAGGMGEVWLAEQTGAVRRQVAIKIIKAGMDTAQVVSRFAAERQALAVMSHPAIAQVFDAGATPQGRPFFAMEYVRGETITLYCSRHKLSTRQRIDLFIQVCEGVQHAHQKGIIHRDLKPSNILVTLRDGVAVPKIIDFGLAKATTQSPAERHFVTEIGALVGTPEYMSPEQAEMTTLDIDTRTDVYALGVILYEMLTGALPFDAKRLREQGLDELRRAIRETDPPRPSTRVTTIGATSDTVASHGVAPADLARQLSGDLDWITLRALEKDRTRRYGSASDLAADLHRHLHNIPVLASPPTATYRLGKFVRRHRVGVALAALVVAVLVAAAVSTAVQANRVAQERDRANREAEVAKAVNEFLQNDLLAQAGASAQARPDVTPDPDLRVRTALDRAAAGIEGKFVTQPLVEASIRTTIGKTYADLGLFPEAEPHLVRSVELKRRVLGEQDASHLASTADLADVYMREGKFEPAERLLTPSLDLAQRGFGDEDPRTLSLMAGLGRVYMMQGKHPEAEPLYVKVLELRRRLLGEEHRDTLEAMDALASLYWRQGKYSQAEPIRTRVVELQRRVLGDEHPTTLVSLNNLALLASYQGKFAEAETIFVKLVETMRRVLGDDHLETMISAGNLGIVYFRQRRYAEAEAIFTRVLGQKQRVLGDEHPETLTSMNNLGVLYLNMGKYPQAEHLYNALVDVQRRVLGADHPNVLGTMTGLARLSMLQGRNSESERLYTEALRAKRRVLGEEHPDTVNTMSDLASLYATEGRNADAEPIAVKVVEIRRRALGEQHPDTVRGLSALGGIHLGRGDYAAAEATLRTALSGFDAVAPDGWEKYNCQSMLGASLTGLQRYEEAEPLVTTAYLTLSERKSTIPAIQSAALDQAKLRVTQLYRSWGRPEKSAEWAKRSEGR